MREQCAPLLWLGRLRFCASPPPGHAVSTAAASAPDRGFSPRRISSPGPGIRAGQARNIKAGLREMADSVRPTAIPEVGLIPPTHAPLTWDSAMPVQVLRGMALSCMLPPAT